MSQSIPELRGSAGAQHVGASTVHYCIEIMTTANQFHNSLEATLYARKFLTRFRASTQYSNEPPGCPLWPRERGLWQ